MRKKKDTVAVFWAIVALIIGTLGLAFVNGESEPLREPSNLILDLENETYYD